MMELEEGTSLLTSEITSKVKLNCNPRHNNNLNAMSIETDVWLLGELNTRVVAEDT